LNHTLHEHGPRKRKGSELEIIESAHKGKFFVVRLRCADDVSKDLEAYLASCRNELTAILETYLADKGLRFFLAVRSVYHQPETDKIGWSEARPCFTSKSHMLQNEKQIPKALDEVSQELAKTMDRWASTGSTWHFAKIAYVDVSISQASENDVHFSGDAGTYVENALSKSKYLKNNPHLIRVPESGASDCFRLCLLAKHYNLNKARGERASSYENLEAPYDFSGVELPVTFKSLERFVKQNPLCAPINIYLLAIKTNGKSVVRPYYVKSARKKAISLLCVVNPRTQNGHLMLIKNFQEFFRFNRPGKMFYHCRLCLQKKFTRKAFARHKNLCKLSGGGGKKPCTYRLSSKPIEFTNYQNVHAANFFGVADMESCIGGKDRKHTVNSYVMQVVSSCENKYSFQPFYYAGEDCIDHFMTDLKQMCMTVRRLQSNPTDMNPDELVALEKNPNETCPLCRLPLDYRNEKVVVHHDHLSGHVHGYAHANCNLKERQVCKFRLYFHNLNYDLKFFLSNLRSIGK
jgi:hypothetical protein